jgi:HEAT repeat protein
MRGLLLLCAAALYAADPETLVRQVAAYDFGKDPAAVRELEALVLRSGPAMEKLLLSGMASAQTLAAKDAFCRDLAIAGTDAAVPKLAAMLVDPDTAEMARYALERIPGARAAAALRDALARSSPRIQTGIVVSLGRRKDAASAAAIKPILASKDIHLAEAAAAALGNIGTPEARATLLAAPHSPAVSAALLGIADAGIYVRLYSAGQSEAVRAAALEGLARVDARQATPLLRTALKSDSVRLQGVAINELARLEGVALAKELPNVAERARVQILTALTDSGRPEVRPILVESAASDSQAVRVAALDGLAKLGTAADVPLLAGRAAAASGDEQSAARAALGAIRGDAADAAILQAIPGAEPKVKVELIRAAGERGAASAPETLLASAVDANRPVRVESIRALRETAGPRQVPALLVLLSKTPNDNDRKELERTVGSAIRRSNDAFVGDVIEAYKSATDAGLRISLLNVLSMAGNPAALPLAREALHDASGDIQRAAINALSGWPSPEPMDDLLALARSAGDATRQILALRGYIKLVQIPSSRAPAETARMLKAAMAAATRPNEKRAVLAVAQRLVCPESLGLARLAIDDPMVTAEARLAVTTLERALSFVK